MSPFNYASNNPVTCIDFWGLQGIPAQEMYKNGKPIGYTTAQSTTYQGKSNAEKRMGLQKAKEYNQAGGIPVYGIGVNGEPRETAKHTENPIDISSLFPSPGGMGNVVELVKMVAEFFGHGSNDSSGNSSENTNNTEKENSSSNNSESDEQSNETKKDSTNKWQMGYGYDAEIESGVIKYGDGTKRNATEDEVKKANERMP